MNRQAKKHSPHQKSKPELMRKPAVEVKQKLTLETKARPVQEMKQKNVQELNQKVLRELKQKSILEMKQRPTPDVIVKEIKMGPPQRSRQRTTLEIKQTSMQDLKPKQGPERKPKQRTAQQSKRKVMPEPQLKAEIKIKQEAKQNVVPRQEQAHKDLKQKKPFPNLQQKPGDSLMEELKQKQAARLAQQLQRRQSEKIVKQEEEAVRQVVERPVMQQEKPVKQMRGSMKQEEVLVKPKPNQKPKISLQSKPSLKQQLASPRTKKRTFVFGSFRKRKELIAMLPHVARLRHTFQLYDGDGCGRIDINDVPECLRAMGLDPTESMLNTSLEAIDDRISKNGQERVTFELVLIVYCALANLNEQQDPEEMLKGLRACDGTGLGVLPYAEMRRMLTTMGERLDDKEVAILLDSATDAKGNVNYKALVRAMYKKDGDLDKKLQQAQIYLDALGRNALDLDMQRRDDFIEELRHWDAARTGFINFKHLLEVLNRSGDTFSPQELHVLTKEMVNQQGLVNYGLFLRTIMNE
ncbi:uncharacterized protein LOC115628032 [Scaptodrosophila lebanonensis]|uniref:Uncharacterized protein LOC115628032 n=1 Tax=Drosophila lebanonensis TaxID=7225 RepID=A0A6J2TUS2_DROLE|nr:uncharacterized protein LOC115628032 [Scaptodrosophila lebanonensis]